jgi:hypothetical protein
VFLVEYVVEEAGIVIDFEVPSSASVIVVEEVFL